VNTILELIKELYPLRTCTYKSNIESEKFKVCLNITLGTAVKGLVRV
jgi:excinuclease ABC subunit C